ncbi:hypothetical protein AAES_48960 [Amazona aestiva]|uniref:Uncharacterized protein n=1 Tax=Amazona aestiva TaxID=12930 RepID=A0A0Q3Q858_AMAAE|nr:hypothetical protein AAES_48960 [Amazona aestiva]
MILGDVEETVTTIEIDEETYEEIYKSTKRNIPMLFVRGIDWLIIKFYSCVAEMSSRVFVRFETSSPEWEPH